MTRFLLPALGRISNGNEYGIVIPSNVEGPGG